MGLYKQSESIKQVLKDLTKKCSLSHDVEPGSDITPCNKIDNGLQIL